MAYHESPSPLPFVRPFQAFFRTEAASGILLLVLAVVALIWANSPWAASYFGLWETIVTVGAGSAEISKPLHLWVNDGLMAIFFFLVGLEIKREVLVGELASPRQAALPLAAAVGGMVVPAGVYLLVAGGTEFSAGWGVPMATDIAFALGVLALLGSRAPVSLKIFLTALAIVDDLGAVLVIAFFYTAKISLVALGAAAVIFALLIAANRMGIQRTAVYVILGIALWVAVLKSGVHATIAGVLLALTIPARRTLDAGSFLTKARALVDTFARDVKGADAGSQRHAAADSHSGAAVRTGAGVRTAAGAQTEPTEDQRDAVQALEQAARQAETPLTRMEHALHGWVAFGIMPVFALANAGVAFGGVSLGDAFAHPAALGILLGLVVGKQAGVTVFSWLAIRWGWASLPANTSWTQLYGVALLTGIGFTMSLFIAALSFVTTDAAGPSALDLAKIGILAGSLISGVAGYVLLKRAARA